MWGGDIWWFLFKNSIKWTKTSVSHILWLYKKVQTFPLTMEPDFIHVVPKAGFAVAHFVKTIFQRVVHGLGLYPTNCSANVQLIAIDFSTIIIDRFYHGSFVTWTWATSFLLLVWADQDKLIWTLTIAHCRSCDLTSLDFFFEGCREKSMLCRTICQIQPQMVKVDRKALERALYAKYSGFKAE